MPKLPLMIVLAGFATAAVAQDAAPAVQRVSKECRQEIQTLCPKGDDPKARRDCMIVNHSKISPDCMAQIKARRDAMKAMRASQPMPPETPPTTPVPPAQ